MVDVEISALSKQYAGQYAVDNVDLTIPSGSFVTLLGPSGCGKTTTLRSIAGLEEPDAGVIRIGQQTMVDAGRGLFVQPEKRRVGMVFQSYALWPHMTVAQNVAYPLRRQKRSRDQIDAEIDRMLELVNLGAQRDRSVAALSGGQQQRVALARAMVGDPVLTLFDEPLSNLDVKLRGRMRAEIRGLHDRIGMTSVYVTHDQEEALALSDVVVVMNGGRVQQIGAPDEIFFAPVNGFVADFVGFENRIPVDVVSGASGAYRFRTASGFEFDGQSTTQLEGSAHAYARPATVSLVPAPGLASLGAGKVLDRTYLGTTHEYRVETVGGVLVARQPALAGDRPHFSAGDAVSLHFDPARVALLPVDQRGARSASAVER